MEPLGPTWRIFSLCYCVFLYSLRCLPVSRFRAQTSLGLPARDGPPGGPSRSGGPRFEPVRAKATSGELVAADRGPQKPQADTSLNPAALQRPAQVQARSQQLLQETGQAMVKEVQRMRATQEQLQQSSNALEQTEASYNGQTRATNHDSPTQHRCCTGMPYEAQSVVAWTK